MFKTYFKQAIEMLKQNKFISTVTIVGTALAIMMIMVIVVTESIKNVNVAPEANRDRTMYLKYYYKKYKDKSKTGTWSSSIPYDMYKDYLSDMKSPELITAITSRWDGNKYMVKLDNSDERILAELKMVDAAYWNIMSFIYLEGKPFTEADFKSGIRNVVITESMAKKVFGNGSHINKTVEIDFKEYNVVGIIKDVSQIFQDAYGELYIPYSSKNGYENQSYRILFLMKDNKDIPAFQEECREAERRFDAVDTEWDLHLNGPYNHRLSMLNFYSNVVVEEGKANTRMLVIFAILLLIPAMNLSSFSISRMKRRNEEIGVRKAFGAKKSVILIQVLFENFITSLIGGIIGLLFSYVIVVWLKEWLLGIDAQSSLPVVALVSIPVFLGVFVACFLLNLLSAGIPAYITSKTAIVDSLNKKNG